MSDGGTFKEYLTVRDHLDPDKHWIGETLPAPTQGELAATVGATSGPGDSPFPARADHMHKLGASVVLPANVGTGVFNFAGLGRGATLTLLDDQAAYLNFNPVNLQMGVFLISSNASTSHGGLYVFRTGDAGAFMATIAQLAGSYTTTIGAGTLAGTTGVDGQFTMRVGNTTSLSRIYLENRTASTRAYMTTVLNLNSLSVVPDTSWTII